MIEKKIKYLFFYVLLLLGCAKESNEFRPISEINLYVYDERMQKVNGGSIAFFEQLSDYEYAIETRELIKANKVFYCNEKGEAKFELEPDKNYFMLVSHFDLERNIRLSNVGVSDLIKPLQSRTKIYIKLVIKPENGNIVFYSKDKNKIPLEISIKDLSLNKTDNYILNNTYKLQTSPTVLSDNILKIQYNTGKYLYNAKSEDGCVWIGETSVSNGKTTFIELSSCETGKVSFYTSIVNDTLLPLKISINKGEIIGEIKSTAENISCDDINTNSFSSILKHGKYTYLITSASGRCIWTDTFIIDQPCKIVPIEACQ